MLHHANKKAHTKESWQELKGYATSYFAQAQSVPKGREQKTNTKKQSNFVTLVV